MAANDGVKPALLFMPDISGFTQFVNGNEITHSQHIIAELLETLIDSNQLGMKISEIEGDAIFFYKSDGVPSPEQISEQCKKMFIAFRQQVKKFDMLRICNCGACSTASQLTLKIVAHEGTVSFMNIQGREKLFGPDVILIHRLMKNDIPEHEYMLMTSQIPLEKISSSGKKEFEWIQLMKGSSTYDLGEVTYNYSPFKSLYNSIPDPPKPELKVYKVKNPMLFGIDINAPMAFVYSGMIELKNRLTVLPGVLEVKIEDEKHNQINKLGTVHECIREPRQGSSMTTDVQLSDDKMIFTETPQGKQQSMDYIVEKTGDESCRLTIAVHVELSLPAKIIFSLTGKKKLNEFMNMSLESIKKVCEEGFQSEKEHVHAEMSHVH
ncbi:MAG: DUF2652 domain-containing protein [Chitinophagales bacterium]